MSHELRRVPLDFDWPLNEVWIGYVNPYLGADQCGACDGSGLGPQAKEVSDAFYGLGGHYIPVPDHPRGKHYNPNAWCNSITQDEVDALVEHGRLTDFTHVLIPGEGLRPKDPPYRPTAEEVNHWEVFGDDNGYGMGHDAINRLILIQARLDRLGLSKDKCQSCAGGGSTWKSRYAEAAYEGWSAWEPPTGDGWQIWETVSEGSPISPVFPTRDALVAWMQRDHPQNRWHAMTKAGAEEFTEVGWVFSMVSTPDHGVESGLEHLDRTAWRREAR